MHGPRRRQARDVAVSAVEVLEQRLHPDFRRALVCGLLALVALIVGSGSGGIHAHAMHARVLSGSLAGAFAVLGVIAVRSAAGEAARVTSLRSGPGGASAVRISAVIAGYLIVLLATLDVLDVPLGHLLVGGALTGVILGIAAQQSISNVVAGVVLLMARPFNVGERIEVRSGAIGGPFCGIVSTIGLVHTTLDTEEGPVQIPNSALLAAAVLRRDVATRVTLEASAARREELLLRR